MKTKQQFLEDPDRFNQHIYYLSQHYLSQGLPLMMHYMMLVKRFHTKVQCTMGIRPMYELIDYDIVKNAPTGPAVIHSHYSEWTAALDAIHVLWERQMLSNPLTPMWDCDKERLLNTNEFQRAIL